MFFKHRGCNWTINCGVFITSLCYMFYFTKYFTFFLFGRLAPVLKTIFHQCVILYTCSQSYSDGSVLRTGSTHTLPTNFLVGN